MSELVRGTEVQQRRTLVRTGAIVATIVAVVLAVVAALPARRPAGALDLTLSTPTLGQGILVDSNVIMRGVPVGTITSIDRHHGIVEVGMRLESNKIHGLTDSFGFDFRPENMFGVSALSLTPREGGNSLANGQRIARSPDINATMSELLNTQLASVTKVLDDTLVQFIKRAANYTSAMAPMIETGLVLANLIAETQRSSSAELVRKFNEIIESTPDMLDFAFTSIHKLRYLKNYRLPQADMAPTLGTIKEFDDGMWGPMAELLVDHRTELEPTVELARSFADAVTTLVVRSRGSMRLDKTLAALNSIYYGPEKPSLKLRLMLEPLPVLQSVAPAPTDLDGNGTR